MISLASHRATLSGAGGREDHVSEPSVDHTADQLPDRSRIVGADD